jgi:hypothetical protein
LLVGDGSDVPIARRIDEHMTNPDYDNGVWAIVDIDTSRYDGKAEKINITVPRRLLHLIDEAAKARHLSRSAFLALAAQHEMTHS